MFRNCYFWILLFTILINFSIESSIKRGDTHPDEDDHRQDGSHVVYQESFLNTDHNHAGKSISDENHNASLYFDMSTFKKDKEQSMAKKHSERNQRALDLDVLLGDKSERHFTGTRQSRILSDDDKSKPNIAIQGFIPILSIGANQQDSTKNKTPQKLDLDANNNEHVHVYTGQTESGYAGPQDAKFIGAALENLASKITGKPKRKYGQEYGNFQQGNCVCVPFYMCKKGYLESSSAKNLAALGVNNNYESNIGKDYEMALASAQTNINYAKRNQHYPTPIDNQSPSQEYPLVDERSIDGSEKKNQNETTPDYVKEILSQMVGRSSDSFTGGCGVLRTCCRLMPDYQISEMENIGSLYSQPSYPSQPLNSIPPHIHHQSHPVANHPFLRPEIHRPELSLPPIDSIHNIYPGQATPVKPISSLFGYQNPLDKYLPFKKYRKQQAHKYQPLPQPPIYQHQAIPQYPPMHIAQQYPQSMYPQSAQEQHIRPQFEKPFMLNNYPSSSISSRSLACGKRDAFGVQGRVLNLQYHESSTEFGEYPWQIAILKRLGPADSLFVCGGALISDQWVVTAAHCIKKNGPQDLKIRLGEWDVHREDEYYPYTEKYIEQIIIHPQFTPGTLLNDIALIKLDSPVQNSQHISPVCLPSFGEQFIGQRCWVTGWGKNAFGQQGQYQSVLREVDVPILDKKTCESLLRNTRLGPYYQLHPGFICAGGERGKDACEGDGGSALVCDVNGVWKAVGLVSWGIGCGQQGVPGVYVDMSQYLNWIDSIIEKFGRKNEQVFNSFDNSFINERSNTNSDYNATVPFEFMKKDPRALNLDRYSIKNFQNLNEKNNSTEKATN